MNINLVLFYSDLPPVPKYNCGVGALHEVRSAWHGSLAWIASSLVPGFFLTNIAILANNAQEVARTVALPAYQLL